MRIKSVRLGDVWLKLPIRGVKVGLLGNAFSKNLVSDPNFNPTAFFQNLLPYFFDSELHGIKGVNCYWQLVINGRKAQAILFAASGNKIKGRYSYREVFEIVYPNFTRKASVNINITPNFNGNGRPLVVQIEDPEKYWNNNASGNPKYLGILKCIYQKVFNHGKRKERTCSSKSTTETEVA